MVFNPIQPGGGFNTGGVLSAAPRLVGRLPSLGFGFLIMISPHACLCRLLALWYPVGDEPGW